MNKYLNNFYNLFSYNKDISYKAVVEKKDWLFQDLYFPYSFFEVKENGKSIYPDIYALYDQTLLFKEASFDNDVFLDHEDKKEEITNTFNNNFSLAYAYDELLPLDKDSFYVQFDFTKIDQKLYQILIANIFPCIDNIKELDFFYDKTNVVDLLRYPMYGNSHRWNIILTKDKLIQNRLYLPYVKKIIYDESKLTSEEIETLKIIASSLKVSLEVMNDK
jgi:hypothetical protein